MSFDLSNYVDVKTRLKQALAVFPQLRVVEHRPEITMVGDQMFIECSMTVSRDPDDPIPVTAYVFEPYPGRTSFTKLAEQMNGSTSCLGRALGYMGFGIDVSIASSNEVMGRQQAVAQHDPSEPAEPGPRVTQITQRKALGSAASNNGGATANQIKMLAQMCVERGLDFDPEAPLSYSEAKEMFDTIKPIPKVK